MTDNMIEAKLDAFRKLQDGITAVGFKMQHTDIPEHLASAALGKRYYLVLVDADYYDESNGVVLGSSDIPQTPVSSILKHTTTEKSEGEKLRIRACCLCGEKEFQKFATMLDYNSARSDEEHESLAKDYIYTICNIKSRSELTTDVAAQERFRELDQKFKDWQWEQRHKDNLDRED